VLRRWKGGAVVVSHDRTLLRGMDRIVELSSLGARSYGGGYDLYAERKAQAVAAAEHDLETRRAPGAPGGARGPGRPRAQGRRDAAGRKFAAKGSEPKILLGAHGRAGREQRRARGQGWPSAAQDAAQAKRGRRSAGRAPAPLAFDLPSCGLPAGRTCWTSTASASPIRTGRR
jgi:ATPase subunit of ABC transporter with duplicated ATPase domains